METSLRFTYRHAEPSIAMEAKARELLEGLASRIITCHILVEGPSTHERNEACTVKIHLMLPGVYIHADSSPDPTKGSDTYSTLCRAFENAKRQLEIEHAG